MIEVYHNLDADFWDLPKNFDINRLVKVAAINTNDLDLAYRLTNSIDTHWSEHSLEYINPLSKPTPDMDVDKLIHYVRSTSIGDVVKLIDGDSFTWFGCAKFGWEEINVD